MTGSDAEGGTLVLLAATANYPFLILAVAAAFVVARRVDRAKAEAPEAAATV